jgi:S1-C subfamily serine protease
MPDYTFEGPGLKIDGVTDGKPASAAGVKTGDVLVEMGGVEIKKMGDYMAQLQKFSKGETTTIKVQRGGEVLTLNVTF